MTTPPSCYEERPVFFPAGGETLFGVIARPRGPANGVAATLVTGGGFDTAIGRNRMNVRLARRLTRLGFAAMRFDYRGVGESSGTVDGFRLEQPHPEDLLGAVACLEDEGLVRHVLVGSCFGCRTLLAGAGAIRGLEAMVMVSPPVRDVAYGRQGIPGGSAPVSAAFVAALAGLVTRRVPVLVVFGSDEGLYEDFKVACDTELGALLGAAGALVDVRVLPGRVHGFIRLEAQRGVLDLTESWLGSIIGRRAATGAGPGVSRAGRAHGAG